MRKIGNLLEIDVGSQLDTGSLHLLFDRLIGLKEEIRANASSEEKSDSRSEVVSFI
jgi:hypothetical protein